jgi:hypothetical protein
MDHQQNPKRVTAKAQNGWPPRKKQKDPLYVYKLQRLAIKIVQIHASYLDAKARLPKKAELHDEIDADETLSQYLGFRDKKRTARNRMIAEAHQLLIAANKE